MAVSLPKAESSLMGLKSRKQVVGQNVINFSIVAIRMFPFFTIINNAELNSLVHKMVFRFCRRIDPWK